MCFQVVIAFPLRIFARHIYIGRNMGSVRGSRWRKNRIADTYMYIYIRRHVWRSRLGEGAEDRLETTVCIRCACGALYLHILHRRLPGPSASTNNDRRRKECQQEHLRGAYPRIKPNPSAHVTESQDITRRNLSLECPAQGIRTALLQSFTDAALIPPNKSLGAS